MPHTLDPELRRALAERVRYYHELGIYDFYRRESRLPQLTEAESAAAGGVRAALSSTASSTSQSELREEMGARKSAVVPDIAEGNIFEIVTPKPEYGVADPVAAL